MLASIRFRSHLLSKSVKIKIHKTIIVLVALYDSETLSLALNEEHRVMVFKNRVQRRAFGPKIDEVMGGWRRLHNELRDLYSSPNIIRMIKSIRIRWAGYVARMGRRGTRIGYWSESKRERDH
jgi:hypothetical protein